MTTSSDASTSPARNFTIRKRTVEEEQERQKLLAQEKKDETFDPRAKLKKVSIPEKHNKAHNEEKKKDSKPRSNNEDNNVKKKKVKSKKNLDKLSETVKLKEKSKNVEAAVDLLLRAQVDGLENVQKKLAKLSAAMKQLTSAVRSTAKYMKLENVILEEEKHMEAMNETKRLLSQITLN